MTLSKLRVNVEILLNELEEVSPKGISLVLSILTDNHC